MLPVLATVNVTVRDVTCITVIVTVSDVTCITVIVTALILHFYC